MIVFVTYEQLFLSTELGMVNRGGGDNGNAPADMCKVRGMVKLL